MVQRIKGNNYFSIMMVICMMIIAWGLSSCQTKAGLEKKICENLLEQYGMEFACESVGIDGGGAFFVCYPTDDPTLLFDGLADSQTGNISNDTFTGALFARDDARIMTETLSSELGEVYVFARPVHHGLSGAGQVIRKNGFNLEVLRKETSMDPNLFFIIFVNTSAESFTDDPGHDYDAISKAVDIIVKHYEDNYDKGICVDMHVYYVNDSELDYVEKYFETQLTTSVDFSKELNYQNCITLQMGPEDNGYYSDTLRLSRDEYIEEKLDEA